MTNIEIDLSYKDKNEVSKGTVLGFFIGLAIIIPGISGSTLAIILKLYDKLLYAIGNIFQKFKICFLFLLPILIGATAGLTIGFIAIKHLLELIPFAVISCFAGLMIGAFKSIYIEVKDEKRNINRIVLLILGLTIPILVGVCSIFISDGNNNIDNVQIYHYLLFIFLGYVVAITQIVPGLSATAILIAFGYYTTLIEGITEIFSNPKLFLVYSCLALGFLVGIVSFSKILAKSLEKNRVSTFFLIMGLSLGSIVAMFINSDTFAIYRSWFNGNINCRLDLTLGIILIIIGTTVASLFVKFEKRK